MKNKVTAGGIFRDLAFCILFLATYIGMFTFVEGSNILCILVFLIINIIFMFVFIINMIALGYEIERYLIDHKIIKEEDNGKDNK